MRATQISNPPFSASDDTAHVLYEVCVCVFGPKTFNTLKGSGTIALTAALARCGVSVFVFQVVR